MKAPQKPEDSAHRARVEQFDAAPACRYCREAGQPLDFTSVRECAFPDQKSFSPNNWQCAAIELLSTASETLDGQDETAQVLSVPDLDDFGVVGTFGWIVMTRYKSRGTCSSATHVGDFSPAESLTYALAARTIELLKSRDTPGNR